MRRWAVGRLELVDLSANAPERKRLTREQEEELAQVSDPVARAVYRKKIEHGVERDTFTLHRGSRG